MVDSPSRTTEAKFSVWTIIVGGGSGRRFGSLKQFESLGAERVIDRSRRVAEMVSDGVVVVVPPDVAHQEHAVAGGVSRADSVRCGLAHVPHDATVICVHDAARPFATPALYERVVTAVRDGADGAIPGVAVTDTIKQVSADGRVIATPARDTLRAVQTPQAFNAQTLRAAHVEAPDATDDAALLEQVGATVLVVAGDLDNRKITHPDDLAWAVEYARRVGP